MHSTQTPHVFDDARRHLPESHVQSLSEIENGYWWYQARVAWAKRMIRDWWLDTDDNAVKYADLGCGTGGFAREIARTFEMTKVCLVDGDANVLKYVKGPASAQVVPMDFSVDWELPFRPNLITCMDVIEHLKDDATFLKRASSQLEKRGCLLISVPAHQSFFSEWDKRLGHHRRYNRRLLESRIRDAGLTIHRVKYMWSFLTPAAPIRKWKQIPEGAPVEFPPVPAFLNTALLFLSRVEWHLTERVSIPFGTSLMISAIKV